MITRKNKLVGFGISALLVLVLLLVGVGLAVAFGNKVPYEFSDEQMTKTYVLERQNYGDYKLIADLPGATQNPIDLEGVGTAILHPSGSFVGLDENDISFVSINEDTSIFEEVVTAFTTENCTSKDFFRGNVGGDEYLMGNCSKLDVYLYKNDNAWIIISTPDGKGALATIIDSFLAQ